MRDRFLPDTLTAPGAFPGAGSNVPRCVAACVFVYYVTTHVGQLVNERGAHVAEVLELVSATNDLCK